MRHPVIKAVVAAGILVTPLAVASPASAHPFGMCHVAGQSGVVVFFPAGSQAAEEHDLLRTHGIHPEDYDASAADQADFEATGNRKCAASRVNPVG